MARVSPDDVELGEIVDEGAHAKVYKARWKGRTVAVKEMEHTRKNQIMYKREVAIHRKISHPNIVKFHGIHVDPKRLWIVMEFAELGSLASLTKKAQAEKEAAAFKFTDEVRLKIMRELADVLQYLHGLSPAIVHHDIKAANILLDGSGSVKLCDFGLSASGRSKPNASTRGRGTPLWSPEEVLQNQANAHHRKVDIYGFALVAWNLWAICEPFAEYTNLKKFAHAMCRDHIRPNLPAEWPLAIRQLIACCWNHDPDQRPAASVLAKHCMALTAESWQAERHTVETDGPDESVAGMVDGPVDEVVDGSLELGSDGSGDCDTGVDGRERDGRQMDGLVPFCEPDGYRDGSRCGIAGDGLVPDTMQELRSCSRSSSLSDGHSVDGQGDVVMDGDTCSHMMDGDMMDGDMMDGDMMDGVMMDGDF